MWLAQVKALSVALGPEGHSVNSLSLGGVYTDRLQIKVNQEASESDLSPDEILKGRVANVPLRSYAELSDIAYAIAELLGDFSKHITGQNIVIDGGFTSVY